VLHTCACKYIIIVTDIYSIHASII
jgi:hypothetical protein